MPYMQEYKNILVIKLGALGDFVQMTGFFSAIRHRWPEAHITLMTNKAFFKMAQQSGYFDDYIEDNRTKNPLDYIRIIRQILAKRFDMIIDLQMQSRTKKRYYPLLRLFSSGSFSWVYPEKNYLKERHIYQKFPLMWGKDSLGKIEFTPEQAGLGFCKASSSVLSLLPKKYVLLIPGCSPAHPYKRWPAAFYKELALRLTKEGISSVVLGTNAEKQEIETICEGNEKAVNFCNKSALLDIPEIAAHSLAVVGNDTGPQHMAELGSVPAVTLFCDITQRSAIRRANVTNLIAEEIADISVDTVFNTLQSLWHKA